MTDMREIWFELFRLGINPGDIGDLTLEQAELLVDQAKKNKARKHTAMSDSNIDVIDYGPGASTGNRATAQPITISKACGYFLVRRHNVPIILGDDWPDTAMATSERGKAALLIERNDGKLDARVLHGVSDWEAVDAAERLAREKDTAAVSVARLAGSIGKGTPASIWQQVKRFSSKPPKIELKSIYKEGFKEVHFQIKKRTTAGDDLRIEGWASTKNIDRDGEIVEPRSVEKTLAASMSSMVLHFNHQPDYVVGKVESIELRDEGMWLNALVSKATNPPQVRTWIEEDTVRALSIRFIVMEDRFDDDGVRHITKAELLEVSVVTMPSNRESTFSISKGVTDGTDLSCSRCHDAHCDGTDQVLFKRWPLEPPGWPKYEGARTAWTADIAADVLKAGGWDLYRDAHALYRPVKADDQDGYRKAGSYLLPHHVIDDDGLLFTSREAVWDAMGQVLSKSTELAEKDRRAAYDHLSRHLQEFSETAPEFALLDEKALATVIAKKDCRNQQSPTSQPRAISVTKGVTMPEETVSGTVTSGTTTSVGDFQVTTTVAPAMTPTVVTLQAQTPAVVVQPLAPAQPASEPSVPAGYVDVDPTAYAALQRFAEGMTEAEYLAEVSSNPAVLNETAELLDLAHVQAKKKT
jgi:HK97 family phage prohead protease